ncbi:selenouridine synthase SelU-like subunit [Methanotorris igneus]|uniref:Rhodanese-like protein n=1 Tax=Methanotorris igneus (strain DSM 5666 / JCM 11834 / Kol 5) TaxID=880724 RepID=F6BEX8_METIK|nr:selenouridine synthase SelU-like subunit [Methanotorris igneus]AEF95714.1 Rhodanese-like protein [Methanotorris igneus Kol 5]
MDEEILARLLTFKDDVVLSIILNDGRKMITDGKKILAGKVSGELASFILNKSKEVLENKKIEVVEFNNYKIYFEPIDIKNYLNSVGKELTDDLITVSDLEELMKKDEVIIVDVRSPREYKERTIPNAINIPLFLDEEHELIGKIYKHEGKDKAMEVAAKIIEEGIRRIMREVTKLDRNKTIVVFCARGGMRSQSIALILKLLGFRVKRLIGGFKAYKHIK